MFSPSNAPAIETRKALLILDVQNDFVKPNGNLFVRNVPDFLDDVTALAHSFRQRGEVIWIQTQFEGWRSIVDDESGNEVVFVGSQPSSAQESGSRLSPAVGSGADNNDDGDESLHNPDPEAFLTVPGRVPEQTCCYPKTTGVQFPAPILSAIDHDQDTVSVKSNYSALQSPDLVLSLRTQFVTEVYLCGSLSNISVYATALDAVRHGFAVTIVEDCVGFRSFNRHMEAMRRMADIMGAVGITTKELIEEHDLEETENARSGLTPPRRGVKPAGIEVEMDDLAVHQSPGSPEQNRVRSYGTRGDESDSDDSRQPKRPTQPVKRIGLRSRDLQEINAEEADDEDDNGSLLLSIPRTRREPSSGQSDVKIQRPRVRRKKVSYKKPEDNKPREANPPGNNPQSLTSAPTTTSTSATTSTATSSSTPVKRKAKKGDNSLGPDDSVGEGDSRVVYDLELSPDAFQQIRNEVNWQKMYHLSGQVPRLVAVQGQPQKDNSIPIYRHPADESPPLLPWTPMVDAVRLTVEKVLKHPLNHVLIQLYRDGQDRISEHSDKTLDIVRGSYICNVSLGAQRAMTLRTKAKKAPKDGVSDPVRQTQKVPLPHNSLFVLGEETNKRWLHSIRPDKRAQSEKSPKELAYNGERISLTFRHIGTFFNPEAETIWGQGAVSKSMGKAGTVIHGDPTETERMIHAFGNENHDPNFSWDEHYGQGFDVVNFVTKSTAKLFPGGDEIAEFRVRFCLIENGIRYDVETDASPGSKPHAGHSHESVYIDPDGVTTIHGDANLIAHFGKIATGDVSKPDSDQLQQIEDLVASWRRYRDAKFTGNAPKLETWEQAVRGKSYLGGQTFNAADCALWPILRDIVKRTGPLDESSFPSLSAYYAKVGRRGCVRQVLEEIHETS